MSDIPAWLALDIAYIARRERERELEAKNQRDAAAAAAQYQNQPQLSPSQCQSSLYSTAPVMGYLWPAYDANTQNHMRHCFEPDT